MNRFTDIAAFQGTGMFGKPKSPAPQDVVRDVRLKSIEYRMGEILQQGGFSEGQTRAIIEAVLPDIIAGQRLNVDNLYSKLQEIGFGPETANAISKNIVAGGRS